MKDDLVKLPVIRKMYKITPKEVIINGTKSIIETEKLIKETRYGEWFLLGAIAKVEPHLNERKRIASKTRCEIFYDLDKTKYVIAKPKDEIARMVNETKQNRIGFKYKGRI